MSRTLILLAVAVVFAGCGDSKGSQESPDSSGTSMNGPSTTMTTTTSGPPDPLTSRNESVRLTVARTAGVPGDPTLGDLDSNCVLVDGRIKAGLEWLNVTAHVQQTEPGNSVQSWKLRFMIPDSDVEGESSGALPLMLSISRTDLGAHGDRELAIMILPTDGQVGSAQATFEMAIQMIGEGPGAVSLSSDASCS